MATKINDISDFGAMSISGRQVMRDSSGNLWAIVIDIGGTYVEAWKSIDGSSWTEQGSATKPTSTNINVVASAIDSANVIHVLFKQTSNSLYYATFTISNTTWSAPEVILSSTMTIVDNASIAVDSKNKPHICYHRVYSQVSDYDVVYKNKVSGSWSSEVLPDPGADPIATDIVINSQDIPVIIWNNSTTLKAAVGNVNNATSFTNSTVATPVQITAGGGWSLAIDPLGNTWVSYIGQFGAVTIAKKPIGSNWTDAWSITDMGNAGSEPVLSIENNYLYVFYTNDANDISYLKIRLGTYYFDASDNSVAGTPDDPDSAWTNDPNACDGSILTLATVINAGTNSSNYLYGKGTNAPSSNDDTIYAVKARIYYSSTNTGGAGAEIYTSGLGQTLATFSNTDLPTASAGWSGYKTLTTPSGGWDWTKLNNLEFKFYKGALAGTVGLYKIELEVITTSDEVVVQTGTYQDVKPIWSLSNQYDASGNLVNSLRTYYFNDTSPLDPDGVWSNDTSAFDNDPATYAQSTQQIGTTSQYYLHGRGTNAPSSDTKTIVNVYARLYAFASAAPGRLVTAQVYTASLGEDLGSVSSPAGGGASPVWTVAKLNTPNGGWDWSKVHGLETKIFADGSGNSAVGYVYSVEIIVQTVDDTTNIDYLFSDNTDIYWDSLSLTTDETLSTDEILFSFSASVTTTTQTISAKAQINPKIEKLYDDFNDNSFDTNKWLRWNGAQEQETNQRLEISSTLAGGYYGINSLHKYDLTGSGMSVEYISGNTTIPSYEEYPIQLYADSQNGLSVINLGGTLLFRKRVSNSWTTLASEAYNATNHRWLRIRESGGTVYFDKSSDGENWTNVTTELVSNLFAITNMYVEIDVGTWQVEASTTMMVIDNINSFRRTRTVTAKASIKRTVTIGGLVVSDFYSETNKDGNYYLDTNDKQKVFQSFNAIIGGELDSVYFYLSKNNNPTGNAVARIYAHTGSYGVSSQPTGDPLATSETFNVATLSSGGTFTLVPFTFTGINRITLTQNTKYCVVFDWTPTTGTDSVYVGRDTSSADHGGNSGSQPYGSSSWSVDGSWDAPFYVYVSNGLKAKARISSPTTRSLTAKANVRNTKTITITAKGRVQISTTRQISAKGRTQISQLKSVTAKARVLKSASATISALARIGYVTSRTLTAKSNIQNTITRTVTAKGNVQGEMAQSVQTIDAKANVINTTTATVTAKAIIDTGKRYWVNGSGSWTDGANHWALTSGGNPNAAYTPTYPACQDVFFDSNSDLAGGTVTVDDIAYAGDFTSTVGSAWTLTKVASDDYLRVFGNLSLGETINATNSYLYFFGDLGSFTIDTNGSTFGIISIIGTQFGSGATWTLLSDLTCSLYFSTQAGTFDANDKNLTAPAFFIQSSPNYPAVTINMGNGTWEATCFNTNSSFSITEYAGSVTLNAEGSTIKLSRTQAGSSLFTGCGKSYNTVYIANNNTCSYEFIGNNTYTNFTTEYATHPLYFREGSTHTFTNFNVTGSAGNVQIIDSGIDSTADDEIDAYNTGLDANMSIKATGYYAGGQVFQGDGRRLKEVWFNIAKYLDPQGSLYVKIMKATGTPNTNAVGDGTVIATSDAVAAISQSQFNTNVPFYFTGNNRILLENGVWYVALFYCQVGDASNYFGLGLDSTTPGHGGNYCQYNGAGWQYGSGYDCIFTVNAQPDHHTLSKASGNVNADYMDIANSHATGGATWDAGWHSISRWDNSGWNFHFTQTVSAKADVHEFAYTRTTTITAKAYITRVNRVGVETISYDSFFREYPESYRGSGTWGVSQNETPPAIREFVNNELHIKVNIGKYYCYTKGDSGLNNSIGTTVEAELKYVSGDEGDLMIAVRDGTRNNYLHIYSGYVKLNSGAAIALDTSVYHVYRLIAQGLTCKAYVDGSLIATVNSPGTTTDRFIFVGDFGFGASATEFYAKRFWYSKGGAYSQVIGQVPYGSLGMYSRAYITAVRTVTVTAKAAIFNGLQKYISAKASIFRADVTQTVTAKATIHKVFDTTLLLNQGGGDSWSNIVGTLWHGQGQSFTPTKSFHLGRIRHFAQWQWGLGPPATPTRLRCKVYTASGNLPNTLVATSYLTVETTDIIRADSGLSPNYTNMDFWFTKGTVLNYNTVYVYIIEVVTPFTGTVLDGFTNSANPYSGGVLVRKNSSDGYQTAASYDAWFEIYEFNSTSQTVTALARIGGVPTQTITAKASISKNVTRTLTAKGLVENHKRYWVLGTGNWEDTGHWSYTSNGSTGAPVPTDDDDVFVDSSSGFGSGGTITLTKSVDFHDFTSTSGHTYTIAAGGWDFRCHGSLTLEAGSVYSNLGSTMFLSTEAGETFTPAGNTFAYLGFEGIGGSWTLIGSLNSTSDLYIENGTFDANDNDIYLGGGLELYADTGFNPEIYLGNGTWSIEGAETITLSKYSGVSPIVHAEGSTIKVVGDGTYGYFYLSSENPLEGYTFNKLWIDGHFSQRYQIYGSNTFSEIQVSAPNKLEFQEGGTTTVTTFNVQGSDGNIIYINSFDGATQATISKASGLVECEYLNIANSNVTGVATFRAIHSTDGGNNTGWLFQYEQTCQSKAFILLNTIQSVTAKALIKVEHTETVTAKASIFVAQTQTLTAKARIDNLKRYWIGNDGLWNDTSHWSYYSNGAGGATPPNRYTDVYFDQYSFTLDGQTTWLSDWDSNEVHNLDFTGVQHTPTLKVTTTIFCYGSLTLVDGMTLLQYPTPGWLNIYFYSSNENKTIITAGQHITNFNIDNGGNPGNDTWTLGDDLYADSITLGGGIGDGGSQTFDTAGYDMEANNGFDIYSINVYLRDSIVNCGHSYSLWDCDTDVNLDAGTSTIILPDGNGDFYGGGKTYYDIQFTGEVNTGGSNVVGFRTYNNTFHNFSISPAVSIWFTSGTTQIITGDLIANGTALNPITITSGTAGTPFIFSKESGTVTVDYVSLKDSTATGGATFRARHSTNVSGNYGWWFEAEQTVQSKAFIILNTTQTVTAKADIFNNVTRTVTAKSRVFKDMPIIEDYGLTPTDNDTVSVTVPSGLYSSKLVAFVGVHQGTINGVAFNGSPLTKIDGGDTAFHERAELWYIDAPEVGTFDLVADFSGGSGHFIGFVLLSNVTQGAAYLHNGTANDNSYADISVTPVIDKTLMLGVEYSEPAPTMDNISGNVELWNEQQNGYENFAALYQQQNTAQTAEAAWDLSYGGRWAAAIAVFASPANLITTTRTVTAKGQIKKSATKTVTAKSRIQIGSTKTITAKARVQSRPTRTLTAKARITNSSTKSVTAKANIRVSTTKTITSKARIQISGAKTITAKARIQVIHTYTITGKGNVYDPIKLAQEYDNPEDCEQLGGIAWHGQTFTTGANTSNIARFATYFAYESGTSATIYCDIYLAGADQKPIGSSLGQSSIDAVTDPTTQLYVFGFETPVLVDPNRQYVAVFSSPASSDYAVWQYWGDMGSTPFPEGGNAEFSYDSGATWSIDGGVSWAFKAYYDERIIFNSYTVTAKAAIFKSINQTIIAKANIKIGSTKTVTAKARIQISTNRTISAKARVGSGVAYNISAKANVKNTITRTVQSKARVQIGSTRTIQSKANVKITSVKTVSAKGRITTSSIKTLQSKARIQLTKTYTINGKGRIQIPGSASVSAKARIQTSATRTVQSKARIQLSGSQTVQSKARINRVISCEISAKAQVHMFVELFESLTYIDQAETTADVDTTEGRCYLPQA